MYRYKYEYKYKYIYIYIIHNTVATKLGHENMVNVGIHIIHIPYVKHLGIVF